MSVTMARTDGVTVLTLTSDPQSTCPPLCQILKGLCYSPVCCSVSQHLRSVQKSSQSILGVLHIMVGFLNVSLGAILCSSGFGSWWQLNLLFPLWYGGMLIVFGITSILSEKYPSQCLVILNVFLNVAGVGFAIAAIVLYCIDTTQTRYLWMCQRAYHSSEYNAASSDYYIMERQCLEARGVVLTFMSGVSAVLTVLSGLELCVLISCIILGVKALRSSRREDMLESARSFLTVRPVVYSGKVQ
ncbi:uncharacterized protein LOC143324776 [Chaetodon auriga]|uniref:uncharacterized protein LOC143324776 n=1 Tax=Chaetodon auriga TaxID=39042 RepID=UPI0040328D75